MLRSGRLKMYEQITVTVQQSPTNYFLPGTQRFFTATIKASLFQALTSKNQQTDIILTHEEEMTNSLKCKLCTQYYHLTISSMRSCSKYTKSSKQGTLFVHTHIHWNRSMVRQLQTYSFVFLGGHLLNSRILLFFFFSHTTSSFMLTKTRHSQTHTCKIKINVHSNITCDTSSSNAPSRTFTTVADAAFHAFPVSARSKTRPK